MIIQKTPKKQQNDFFWGDLEFINNSSHLKPKILIFVVFVMKQLFFIFHATKKKLKLIDKRLGPKVAKEVLFLKAIIETCW